MVLLTSSLRQLLCSAVAISTLSLSPLCMAGPEATVSRLIGQGQHRDALGALRGQPRNLENRFLEAWLLQQLGEDDKAIAAYEALIADAPNMPEPYNNLAVLYAAKGEHHKARDALLSAINTHPSYATAYENLGNIYAKMAVSAYNRALDNGEQGQPGPIQLANIDNLPETSRPAIVSAANQAALTLAAAPHTPTVSDTPAAATAQDNSTQQKAGTKSAQHEQATRDVVDTVVGWSAAWSAQDVDAYLAYYAAGFAPDDGLSRASWEAQRRQRLRAPRFIKITIEAPRVELLDPDTASMRFRQNYQSDRYSDATLKKLMLKKINGQWQILSEQSNG